MNKTQARRLLYLADNLVPFVKENSRRVKFYMDMWVGRQDSLVTKTNPCGTSCCAFGFAGLMPYFQRLGLTTVLAPPADPEKYEFVRLVPVRAMDKARKNELGFEGSGGVQGHTRVLFGLTEHESFRLFVPPKTAANEAIDERPATVAKRLRDFVLARFPDLADH